MPQPETEISKFQLALFERVLGSLLVLGIAAAIMLPRETLGLRVRLDTISERMNEIKVEVERVSSRLTTEGRLYEERLSKLEARMAVVESKNGTVK